MDEKQATKQQQRAQRSVSPLRSHTATARPRPSQSANTYKKKAKEP